MQTAVIVGIAIFILMIVRTFGLAPHTSDWTFFFLIGLVVAAVKWKSIARSLDYMLVKYPATPTAIPTAAPGKSTSEYQKQADRERTLTSKLDADTEIAEAAIRLERARAALADAEREVASSRH
jgi:hypothetical protein